MNVAAHDRREERRIARQLADLPVPAPGSHSLRSAEPKSQGITPTDLRKKVHRLGPSAHLVRIGGCHYVATVGHKRFEGYLGEVNDQLQTLFKRFDIP